MLNIAKIQDGTHLAMTLSGRLETSTAPQLELECNAIPADIQKLTLDLGGLRYISSAGLRVILKLEKKLQKQGAMEVKNASPIIMEVFELTGFSSMLTFI